jgi:hypothetical protein
MKNSDSGVPHAPKGGSATMLCPHVIGQWCHGETTYMIWRLKVSAGIKRDAQRSRSSPEGVSQQSLSHQSKNIVFCPV